jgi:hypothetical protein
MKVASMANVMRWFDLTQELIVKKNGLTDVLALVPLNLDDVPEPAAPVSGRDQHCSCFMHKTRL